MTNDPFPAIGKNEMPCFCAQALAALLESLPTIPTAAGLVPLLPMVPPTLLASVTAAAGFGSALLPSANAAATAAANASASANLSAMASLSAAMTAATGMGLAASLAPSAVVGVRAGLVAGIASFNAAAGPLLAMTDLLQRLLSELQSLARLAGLVTAIRAAFGIDLRAPGAIVALQARLNAAGAASVSASAGVPASAVLALMASLGFQATAQGAAGVNAQAQATASLLAGLPPLGTAFHPLMLLSALLALVAAILRGLGVNLLAPNAASQLRASVATLPLAALGQMQVNGAAAASAAGALAASAGANAAASLNLAATASANLSGAAQLAAMLNVMAQGGLSRPAGSCGVCPLVVPSAVVTAPGLSPAGSLVAAPAAGAHAAVPAIPRGW